MRSLPVIACLLPAFAPAQVPVAELDTAVIRIGEQASVLLSLEMPGGITMDAIGWPAIGDTLGQHVEVVHAGALDTVHTSGDVVHLVQEVRVTSFDTGFWAIVPFRFMVDGRSLETEPLLLEVRGVDLGERPSLRDIKPIHEVPFSIISWFRRHWYILAAVAAIAVLAYLVVRHLKRRQPPAAAPAPAPQRPLHERILQQLKELEQERLWQNGEHKRYHSRLTDLLRVYVEERYQVPAMERTTDELANELKVTSMPEQDRLLLVNMLRLSDMVKFAKALPSPAENERIMRSAVSFVLDTTPSRSIAHA